MIVEEQEIPSLGDDKRAYKLVNIEKYQPSAGVSQKLNSSLKVGTGMNIADLYAIVKTFDKYLVAGKKVNPALRNKDGTPKVFYHGTDAEFTAFDPARFNTREESGGKARRDMFAQAALDEIRKGTEKSPRSGAGIFYAVSHSRFSKRSQQGSSFGVGAA